MNNLQSILLMNGKLTDWLPYLEEKADVRPRLEENEPRCSLCNSDLESVNRIEIDGKVPRNVLSRLNEFWRCPACRKIYWQGSHWKNMRELLGEIERKSGGR